MPTQRRTPRAWQQSLRLLLSTLCACVDASSMGTPTPEPPDYVPLPAPSDRAFESRTLVGEAIDTIDGELRVPLNLPARTVPGGSEVIFINLDVPDSPPTTLRANDDGSLIATLVGRSGQRVRFLYRSGGLHSLPLDLEFFGSFSAAALRPLTAREVIDCVSIEPSDEMTRAIGEGESTASVITVDNRCSESVTITRAELRFGDRGFRLTSPPESVPSNSRAELNVIFPRHTGEGDRSDIVLVDFERAGQTERHALGVWSIAPSED